MAGKVTDNRGESETSKAEEKVDDVFSESFDQADESSATDQAGLNAADDSDEMLGGKKDGEPEGKAETKEEAKPELKLTDKDAAAKQADEPEEKYEQRYKTLQGMFKKDKETWESERAKLLAQIEEGKRPKASTIATDAKSPEKPLTDKQAADLYDSLSPEDKEALANYDETWDVVSKMEGLKRKAELGRLAQTLKDEIRSEYKAEIESLKAQITPITARIDGDDLEAHFDFIRSRHEDFETYQEGAEGHVDLVNWIQSKPKYLQPALFQTIKKGKADEVADMLDDFKRENNIPIASQPPEKTNVVAMTPKKAEKKAALSSVTSRRGSVSTGFQIKEDYEGAFEEAVNKG